MKAAVGDTIVAKGRHVGDGERTGEVLEVHGADGAPPYLVRWDDGHEGLVFPGGDSLVTHHGG